MTVGLTGSTTSTTSVTSAKARVRLDTRPRPEARPGRARGRAATLDAPVRGRAAVLDTPRQDRTRSAAAQRGYARKAQRQAAAGAGPRIRAARRTPFVLLVMALLAAGLIASLWLSTAAAGDSYRLDSARHEARDLTERAEQLRQDVATMQTAPQLAQRARDLGMVPVAEPARLVRQPDGTVAVIGKPTPAAAPAPVASPAGPGPAGPDQPPADAQPPAEQLPAQPPAQQPPGQQAPPQQPPPQRPPPAGGG
jgi:hypothetical protein